MKFFDVEQNSDEWDNLRVGVITSSKIPCIMANYGSSFGEVAKKYAINLVIEQLTETKINNEYFNKEMQRGHEQEPLARCLYEEYTFSEVLNGGFFTDGIIGCSPDGLICEDGLIEVKSVIPTVHFANVKRQNIDPAYKWQIISNLKFTCKEWIDFISFCDQYPDDKKLFIYRSYKEEYKEEFEMIDIRINEFIEHIKKQKEIILNSKYINY